MMADELFRPRTYEFLQDRKVLVTGGSGFIGQNIVQALVTLGCDVLNVDNKLPRYGKLYSNTIKCSILDSEGLGQIYSDFSPSLSLHLAARTDLHGKTYRDYPENVQGVTNVVKAVNECGSVERAIYFSSRLVFDIQHKPRHLFDYKPSTPYGASKVLGESIVRSQASGSVPWMILRPTSIWGEYFDIPYRNFFDSIRAKRYLHPRNLSIQKSFGYVGNSVFQVLSLISANLQEFHGKVYFLADYTPIDVLAFADEVSRVMSRPPIPLIPLSSMRLLALLGDGLSALGYKNPPLTTFRLNNLTTDMLYDLSAEEALTGPLPYSTSDGIVRTVKWLESLY